MTMAKSTMAVNVYHQQLFGSTEEEITHAGLEQMEGE